MVGKVKAAVLTNVREMKVRDFPKPEVADDCALFKVDACGVCGTDPHIYEGHLPVPYPIILGHEASCTIEEMGSKFPRLDSLGNKIEEGYRVTMCAATPCGQCYFCKFEAHRSNLCEQGPVYGITLSCADPPHLFGAYSEYLYVLPRSWIYKAPEDMKPEVLALVDPLSVGVRGLERAYQPGIPYAWDGFGLGKTVVIQGLGPIGILTAAAAKTAGARRVIGIEGIDLRIELAQKFGVDQIIDLKTFTKPKERIAEVRRLTGGLGADVTIELAGVPVAFQEGIEMTRRGGKYVEVGHFTDVGTIPINPQHITFRDLDILGVWAYPPTVLTTSLAIMEMTRDKYPYEELVTHKFSIEETEKAILTSRDKKCCKAIVMKK